MFVREQHTGSASPQPSRAAGAERSRPRALRPRHTRITERHKSKHRVDGRRFQERIDEEPLGAALQRFKAAIVASLAAVIVDLPLTCNRRDSDLHQTPRHDLRAGRRGRRQRCPDASNRAPHDRCVWCWCVGLRVVFTTLSSDCRSSGTTRATRQSGRKREASPRLSLRLLFPRSCVCYLLVLLIFERGNPDVAVDAECEESNGATLTGIARHQLKCATERGNADEPEGVTWQLIKPLHNLCVDKAIFFVRVALLRVPFLVRANLVLVLLQRSGIVGKQCAHDVGMEAVPQRLGQPSHLSQPFETGIKRLRRRRPRRRLRRRAFKRRVNDCVLRRDSGVQLDGKTTRTAVHKSPPPVRAL